MKIVKLALLLGGMAITSACVGTEGFEGSGVLMHGGVGPDKSQDYGINSHHLSTLVAGIWVDPEGCDHWIIDDGVEGYLSPRLTPDGRPVCSGVAPPNSVVGPFKDGSPIPDLL